MHICLATKFYLHFEKKNANSSLIALACVHDLLGMFLKGSKESIGSLVIDLYAPGVSVPSMSVSNVPFGVYKGWEVELFLKKLCK